MEKLVQIVFDVVPIPAGNAEAESMREACADCDSMVRPFVVHANIIHMVKARMDDEFIRSALLHIDRGATINTRAMREVG